MVSGPFSRRRFLVSSTAALGVAAVGGTVLSPTAAAALDVGSVRARARSLLGAQQTARPTGSDYVRYEDLYRQGDSVGAALARLTQAKIVTFPEGQFVCSDFNSGFQAGISVPAHCRGIVGSGPGTLGGSRGTVFTMATRSSTKANGARDSNGRLYVPNQDNSTPCQLNLLKQVNQNAPAVWKNFQVAGTEQGHIFSAFQVANAAGGNTFENVLISGWSGNAGAPPGETSALAVSGRGAHVVTQVEADGRRSVGGEVFGAMGLTFQNSVGATFRSCYVHDVRAANFVIFQSFNGLMVDCTSDALVQSDKALGNGGVNFERASGWTLVNPALMGRNQRIHIAHSNDNWSMSQDGTTYSVRNGSLKVVNPTYNDLWGNNLLIVQSWNPYGNGDTLSTPPLVRKSDWTSHLTYKWIHGSAQTIY